MKCPGTQIYVSDSIFDDHRPTSYDATKTHSLPTVIFDSADESPSPSGGCVLLDKAISHGITQTGICESPIIKSGNSNQSDLSPREQNDNQKQDSTENYARIQLHNMPLIECPIGSLNSNTVTKNRVENITMPKPAGQDYNEIQVNPETSEERLEDSSNIQSHDMKQGEVETDDSQSSDIKTVKMINNYLEHMDPDLLLKAIPTGKLMQLLAPSLDKVPPEWKLKVAQDLEYRMIESQSAQGPTGDHLQSHSSSRRENNHYCDLTGLNLG